MILTTISLIHFVHFQLFILTLMVFSDQYFDDEYDDESFHHHLK